jgi:nitroreductase
MDTLCAEEQIAAFRELVEGRRSVRRFLAEPVPEAVVRECLRLAVLAPNSSNLQAWEFHWVRTPEKKAALAQACLGQQAATTADVLIVAVARTKTWRAHCRLVLESWPGEPPKIVRSYYRRLAPFMYSQGPLNLFGTLKRLVFFVAGLFQPVPREPCSKADMRVWAVKSTALACENLMLAFRAHGYDTCPMEGFDGARVKRLIGLPRDASIPMVLAAGRGAPGGIYNERMRLPMEAVVKEL